MAAIRRDGVHRRTFLAGAIGFGVAAGIPRGLCAAPNPALLDDIVTIDIHSHPGPAYKDLNTVPGALARIKRSKLTAFTYSIVADAPLLRRDDGSGLSIAKPTGKNQLRDYSFGQLDAGVAALKDAGIGIMAAAGDIATAKRNGAKAAILAIEGGDFAEDDLGAVERAHGLGVRLVQPVHKRGNRFADSQEDIQHGEGLSEAGKAFVRELERLKIVIDVSHMTEAAVRKTAGVATRPLILSHVVHVEHAPRSKRFKRWAQPAYARIVADTGGVVGVWNLTGSGLAAMLGHASEKAMFIDTFRHLADTFGVDHVGLGSDLDSTTGWFDSYERLPELVLALGGAGFKDDEIGKMLGGNVLRVIEAVLAA